MCNVTLQCVTKTDNFRGNKETNQIIDSGNDADKDKKKFCNKANRHDIQWVQSSTI